MRRKLACSGIMIDRLSAVPTAVTTILTTTYASRMPSVAPVSATPVALLANQPGTVERRLSGSVADRHADRFRAPQECAPPSSSLSHFEIGHGRTVAFDPHLGSMTHARERHGLIAAARISLTMAVTA